jgi:hypothetical protein
MHGWYARRIGAQRLLRYNVGLAALFLTAACGQQSLPRANPVPTSFSVPQASSPITNVTATTIATSTTTSVPGLVGPTRGLGTLPVDTLPTDLGTIATVMPASTVPPDFSATSPKVAWQGTTSYLHGANLPWYNWSCDFGCGDGSSGRGVGVSADAVTRDINETFAAAEAARLSIVRWWVFPGDPWQIEVGADGLASGVDDAVFRDFDAALFLAAAHNIDLVFTLFSAPSAIPAPWLETEEGRTRLAIALGELFARYPDQVHTWQLFNEPEWEIWSDVVAEADVRAAVEVVAESIRANSRSLVSVGSARLDALPMWVGAGLDYYTAHWYDPMGDGEACAICTSYPEVAERYGLDAPLVIGEFYAGADPAIDGRFESLFDRGYAGAWGWSLLPNRTADKIDIDLVESALFAQERLAVP